MRQMQAGGMLENLPPEAIADGAVMNGTPVGEVNVPGGGGPVDDGVPTELPEGTFVLNAAAVEYHGTKHINDLIRGAIVELMKEGVPISGQDLNPEDEVPVAISNGEYIIPPEVAVKIGIKKLESMNERGLEYRQKVEEAAKQEAAQQEQAMQSFMGQPMPQQAAPAPAPMPQEAAQAPIQSEQQLPMNIAGGGRVPMKDALGPVRNEDKSYVREFFDRMMDGILFEEQTRPLDAIPGGGSMQDEIDRRRGHAGDFKRPDYVETPPEEGHSFVDAPEQVRVAEATPLNPLLPRVSTDNLSPWQRKPEIIRGDPNNPSKPVPMTLAQTGGTIERDPQATFLLPQAARQVQGLPVGAHTYPTSPQESFVGSNITGSVLANLPNAAPTPIVAQPNFMGQQQQFQKKNSELTRQSFVDGTQKPLKKPLVEKPPVEKSPVEKLLEFMSPADIAAILVGEDGTGTDHQKIMDTILNRLNADKIPDIPNALKTTVSDRAAFKDAYETLDKHMIEPSTGNLINREKGTLVATKKHMRSLEEYVKNALKNPAVSDATHYSTIKRYKDPNAPKWLRSKRLVHPNVGDDPDSEHIFFKEITPKEFARREAYIPTRDEEGNIDPFSAPLPQVKPNIMEAPAAPEKSIMEAPAAPIREAPAVPETKSIMDSPDTEVQAGVDTQLPKIKPQLPEEDTSFVKTLLKSLNLVD